MAQLQSYKYQIRSRDTDFRLQATLTAIYDYVLQTAGSDANQKGFGIHDLNIKNASWVLSRIALETYQTLHEFDEITVQTWISEISRVMTTRNIVVYNSAGECVAAAVTQWAMIDLDNRTPLDLRIFPSYEQYIRSDMESPLAKPTKVPPIVNPQITGTHKVVYSDIDFNHHVNSVRYLQWMFDVLPLDTILEHNSFRTEISYLHESRYGETMQVRYEPREEGQMAAFEIQNEESTAVCRAKIKWQ